MKLSAKRWAEAVGASLPSTQHVDRRGGWAPAPWGHTGPLHGPRTVHAPAQPASATEIDTAGPAPTPGPPSHHPPRPHRPTPAPPPPAQLAVLQRLQEQHGALAPALADANTAVRELKSHLQSVYDADLLLDPELRALTALHAVAYATRTLDRMSEPGRYSMEVRGGRTPASQPASQPVSQ
jgi:hypothetical protein